MPPTPFWMSSLNTTNIGRIERGLVVMGCVVDVVRGVLASIKRGHPERGRGIPIKLPIVAKISGIKLIFGFATNLWCPSTKFRNKGPRLKQTRKRRLQFYVIPHNPTLTPS